jgi:SAM-dependent methyltransferase
MASILQKNWLIARRLEQEMRAAARKASGLLLDAGCGEKPYARIFESTVARHIGLDVPDSPLIDRHTDILGAMQTLPLKDGSVSTILCTEALQYVPAPHAVMAEFFRVLKHRGVLILTTTQMWHVTNPPHDRFRFTEYGLRTLADAAGFTVLYHRPLGSVWMWIGLKICYAVHRLNRSRVVDVPLRLLLVIPQLLALAMDTMFFSRKDVINHVMILAKT